MGIDQVCLHEKNGWLDQLPAGFRPYWIIPPRLQSRKSWDEDRIPKSPVSIGRVSVQISNLAD